MQDFPEQKAYLLEDFATRIGPATDEFVRWASPVMTFKRTAVQDTVLDGVEIAEGEKVVMFYPSGNRDESVLERPNEVGEPDYLVSNFVHGVKSLPCSLE